MASPRIRLCRDLRSAAAAVSRSRDVIFEILSWLPAKSLYLYRCRCVSKEWLSVPHLLQRSRAEPLLVCNSSVSGTTTLQLMDTDGGVVQRFPPREGNWTLWASLDDLACISSDSGRCTTLLVMDLSTGKALLPTEDVVAGVLMYASCGRAAPARTGRLKVFRLDAQLICEVLTLGNGASRWRQDHYDVLSFDLDYETWKVIPGPPAGIVGTKKSISLADLNGTLCMARKVHPLVADIWLLTDTDSNSWIKAYSLPVDLFADFVVPSRWEAALLLLL